MPDLTNPRLLRVLAITDFYHPRAGGVERVVRETASRLGERGFVVEILTRRLTAGAAAEERVDGRRLWRVGRGPAPMPLELATVVDEGRRWAGQHLGRFDLVHAHLSFVARPFIGPIRALGLPLVCTYYGPWHREYLAELGDAAVPSRWPPAVRRRVLPIVAGQLRRTQRAVIAAADAVIALSRYSVGELGRELGVDLARDVRIVPGGVDVDRFRPRDRAEARRRLGLERPPGPLLVTVRRLVPRMGLDGLIAALGLLRARGGGGGAARLAIAGVGPLDETLRQQAVAAGLGEQVLLLGRVADDELPWLYAAADLVVIPTRALEGFGLPVVEAWGCGIPVVGTPVGALAETIVELDPALLCRAADPSALADGIASALAAGPLRLAERARDLAMSYRWERVTERLAAVYHQTMQSPGSRQRSAF